MWKILDRAEVALAILFLIGTVLSVLVGAVGRAAGLPFPIGPEIAQLLLIWTCMFGADLTIKRGGHIRVSALPDAIPARYRLVLIWVCLLSMFPFLGYLAFLGFQLALNNWQRELGASGLSYGLVTLALPVGAVLMSVSLLRRLISVGALQTLVADADEQEYPL